MPSEIAQSAFDVATGGGPLHGFVQLAYTPFIDPINIHRVWFWMLIPLALGISVVYKAVRVGDLRHYPRQVLAMTLQIVGAMVLLGVGSYLLIQHVIPIILPIK